MSVFVLLYQCKQTAHLEHEHIRVEEDDSLICELPEPEFSVVVVPSLFAHVTDVRLLHASYCDDFHAGSAEGVDGSGLQAF